MSDLRVDHVIYAVDDLKAAGQTFCEEFGLSWQLAGVASLAAGAPPIFIEWSGPDELHPGRAKADHRVSPRGIAWIEVAADEQSLRSWLGDFDFELRIIHGAPKLSAVAISTDAGELVLR